MDKNTSISSVSQLAHFLGESSLASLGKRFYNITECGVNTEFLTLDDSHFYTDDYYGVTRELPNIWAGHKVIGVRFHTIVEGSDAELSAKSVCFPCTWGDIADQINCLEAEANAIWHEENA